MMSKEALRTTTSKETRDPGTESARQLALDELENVTGGAYQFYIDIKGQKQGSAKGS